jgi:Ca2+-binding RTX toxin-like protein
MVGITVLGPACAAHAATVSLITVGEGLLLTYSAAPGEANRLVVSADTTTLTFADGGASVSSAPIECTVSDGVARCASADIAGVAVELNDGVDTGRIDDSFHGTRRELRMSAGSGDDVLTGGVGPETLNGEAGDDRIAAGAGDDVVNPGVGADIADAGAGADVVLPGPGDDELFGGPGVDIVEGGAGRDRVDGGAGDDTVRGQLDDDVVLGGAGEDRLDVEVAADPNRLPELATASGADQLDGGPGDDLLWGGAEADLPDAPDVLSGGDGFDTMDYSGRRTRVRVSLDGRADDGAPGESDTALSDLERIVGGADGDTLIGSSTANTLEGGPGDDLLVGLGGADVLLGGTGDGGSDTLRGDAGMDMLRGGPGDDELAGGADRDSLEGEGGADTLAGEDGADILAGGAGIDALNGGGGNDVLRGGDVELVGADGGDELDGGPGDDVLEGGAGADRLDGGLGADRMSGGEGRDTVSYEGRGAPVRVTFDTLPNDGEEGEGDNVASDIETVIGGTVDDELRGDARANSLMGGSGEDHIDGRAGVDVLAGGTAADILRARDGTRDLVACDAGDDFAIVDRVDVVRDCEWVDRGTRRRPVLARDALVRRAGGPATFRLPGARRFTALPSRLTIPLGSTIDAAASTVRVTSAADRSGGTQVGHFTGGAFTLAQQPRGRSELVVRLAGGSFRA